MPLDHSRARCVARVAPLSRVSRTLLHSSMGETRHSRLAPFDPGERIRIAALALTFFSPLNYRKHCEVLGRAPENVIRPFSVFDFTNWLKKTGALPDADRCRQRILDIVNGLERHGILSFEGTQRSPIFGKSFYFARELTTRERTTASWFAAALGLDCLRYAISPALVRITGENAEGDVCGGTGVLISNEYVLTCEHVVTDMKVKGIAADPGHKLEFDEILVHPQIDVSVVHLKDAQ
jgi:hypothetical protein